MDVAFVNEPTKYIAGAMQVGWTLQLIYTSRVVGLAAGCLSALVGGLLTRSSHFCHVKLTVKQLSGSRMMNQKCCSELTHGLASGPLFVLFILLCVATHKARLSIPL
jgi:hypothetical protein